MRNGVRQLIWNHFICLFVGFERYSLIGGICIMVQEYGMKISMISCIDSEIVDGVETRLFVMKRNKYAILGGYASIYRLLE